MCETCNNKHHLANIQMCDKCNKEHIKWRYNTFSCKSCGEEIYCNHHETSWLIGDTIEACFDTERFEDDDDIEYHERVKANEAYGRKLQEIYERMPEDFNSVYCYKTKNAFKIMCEECGSIDIWTYSCCKTCNSITEKMKCKLCEKRGQLISGMCGCCYENLRLMGNIFDKYDHDDRFLVKDIIIPMKISLKGIFNFNNLYQISDLVNLVIRNATEKRKSKKFSKIINMFAPEFMNNSVFHRNEYYQIINTDNTLQSLCIKEMKKYSNLDISKQLLKGFPKHVLERLFLNGFM